MGHIFHLTLWMEMPMLLMNHPSLRDAMKGNRSTKTYTTPRIHQFSSVSNLDLRFRFHKISSIWGSGATPGYLFYAEVPCRTRRLKIEQSLIVTTDFFHAILSAAVCFCRLRICSLGSNDIGNKARGCEVTSSCCATVGLTDSALLRIGR